MNDGRSKKEISALPPEQQRFIAEAKAYLEFTTRQMGAKLDRAGVTEPQQRAENVIQNVMRTMLEVCLNSVPYHTPDLPIGLAFLVASYALSALPADQQEEAVWFFVSSFPNMHGNRMRQGIKLETEWAHSPPTSETKQ